VEVKVVTRRLATRLKMTLLYPGRICTDDIWTGDIDI
jgi:hypothetical protein